jgi:hypothetical protein
MAEPAPQKLANHARYVPLFHFVGGGLVLVNLLWSFVRIYHALRVPGRFAMGDAVDGLLVAILLVILFWYARQFPLSAQDRVIRLEMRLRLAQLLAADLRGRIGELRPDQLIALRFASDEELPELVRQVLDGRLTTGSQIKSQIRDWQADHMRV